MTDGEHTRRPLDHRQVVGVCLHIAVTSTELLSLRASDRDVLRADLNPLGHGIRMTVAEALSAAAKHVEAFAEITGRDFGERATAEQEAAKAEAVYAVGREIAALAQRASNQTITFAEFESIRVRLTDLGFALKPHHSLDVALAVAGR